MKLKWLGYLVYGNCVMKLCIEIGLRANIGVDLQLMS